MQFFKGRLVFSALLMGVVFSSTAAYAASPVAPALQHDARERLASHQAVYDIRMSSSKSGTQILDIRGKMFYSLKKSCEGWITDHRFTMVYEYSDTPAIQVDTHFASFESYDGKKMDFSSSRSRDGEVYEEIRGKAFLGSEKAEHNVASYSLPKNIRYDLGASTLFPMAHTYRLIEAAENGQHLVNAIVFDGSDEQGPVEINAIIGKKNQVSAEKSEKVTGFIDSQLLTSPSWNMRLAVFSADQENSLADYELSMKVLQNGIVRDMNVDYHDFSITQKLVALKSVAAEDCQD